MVSPLRVFVGTAANHEDAESQAVLEHSIRSRTMSDVEITWMRLSKDPGSPFYSDRERRLGWDTTTWATPFTGFRWAVPSLAGFTGRALYMDSDMIVLADLAELFSQQVHPGCIALTKTPNRSCVMLFDCVEAQSKLPHVEDLMRSIATVKTNARTMMAPFINGNWNCLDGEKHGSIYDPEIKILHYTSMPHQPHLPRALERLAQRGHKHWFDGSVTTHWRKDVVDLFEREFSAAVAAGYTVDRYEQDPPFGPYAKRPLTHLRGKKPGWSA